MTEYKSGDRVVRTFEHTATCQKGTIENRYSQTSDYYLVKEDDSGESRFWYSDYFELLKEEFNVGDRVRRTYGDSDGRPEFNVGAIGTLKRKPDSGGWMVECSGKELYWSTINFEKDNTVNDVEKRDKLIRYLLDPREIWRSERYDAFRELTSLGVFNPNFSTEYFITLVNNYAEENKNKFCARGIEDARKATGIEAPIKTEETVFTVTLTRLSKIATSVGDWGKWMEETLNNNSKGFAGASFKVGDNAYKG